jgi:hypothetical protein
MIARLSGRSATGIIESLWKMSYWENTRLEVSTMLR